MLGADTCKITKNTSLNRDAALHYDKLNVVVPLSQSIYKIQYIP